MAVTMQCPVHSHSTFSIESPVAHLQWIVAATLTIVPGGTIVAVGPIVAPVLRSMTSKTVPLSERGILFQLFTLFISNFQVLLGILFLVPHFLTVLTSVFSCDLGNYKQMVFIIPLSGKNAVHCACVP
jgi:hypothetical protein